MGVIRGILFVLVAVVLFLSLIIGNVLWTLNLSLDYDNVKSEMGKFVDTTFENQNIDELIGENLEMLEIYCQTNSEYVFNFGEFTENSDSSFTISCSDILEGPDAIADSIAGNLVYQYYYKEYDCDFLNCFGSAGPLFLISEKSKLYWESQAYFFLVVCLVLTGVLFLLAHKKSNTFIVAGALLIVASLPFSKLDLFLNFFSDKFILGLLAVFFSESYTVFVISLVAGIALVVVGISLKVFKVGFLISDLFSRIFKKGKEVPVKEKIEKPKVVVKPKPKEKKISKKKSSKKKKFNFFNFMKKKKKKSK